MKNIKHTPGPWNYCCDNEAIRAFICSDTVMDDYNIQVNVIAIDRVHGKNIEERKANLKLIAAAHDLLDALKYCEEYIRRCLAIEGKCSQQEIDYILKQPREAIAKAATQ